ncbi:unnamed protein product [Vitrella brassicaformis CCMP3155]|uniref:Uncharacterized protein n=1 Tax=Vitrella brassicaformis (strain CCMP3155) TaxID=1169540 RepID=A0A0G4G3Z5_VITBC|nr:unnamed protein product [Vitrella brassicaformis CCMP3155]|eukprot:CEM22608.1 unnamed protein product [Vitrella brassicaformis CCMP3155]
MVYKGFFSFSCLFLASWTLIKINFSREQPLTGGAETPPTPPTGGDRDGRPGEMVTLEMDAMGSHERRLSLSVSEKATLYVNRDGRGRDVLALSDSTSVTMPSRREMEAIYLTRWTDGTHIDTVRLSPSLPEALAMVDTHCLDRCVHPTSTAVTTQRCLGVTFGREGAEPRSMDDDLSTNSSSSSSSSSSSDSDSGGVGGGVYSCELRGVSMFGFEGLRDDDAGNFEDCRELEYCFTYLHRSLISSTMPAFRRPSLWLLWLSVLTIAVPCLIA